MQAKSSRARRALYHAELEPHSSGAGGRPRAAQAVHHAEPEPSSGGAGCRSGAEKPRTLDLHHAELEPRPNRARCRPTGGLSRAPSPQCLSQLPSSGAVMADKAQSSVRLAAKKPSKANGEESAEAPTRIVGGHSAPSSREQPNAPVVIFSGS